MHWFLIIFVIIQPQGQSLQRGVVISTTPFQQEQECADTMNDLDRVYQQVRQPTKPLLHFICARN